MDAKIIFFILLGIAVAFEVVADVLFRKWALENRTLLLGIGLALYFIGTIFWAYSLRHEYLSKAIVVFTVLNLIAVVLVGALFFNEKLSVWSKVGVGLGVLSVVLMEL